MIGDSLTVGNFGKAFAKDFAKSNSKRIFIQSAAWGSSPKDWSRSYPIFKTIGLATRKRNFENVIDPTEYFLGKQLYDFLFGVTKYDAPKIAALASDIAPDHLVVALGTNLLWALQRGESDEDARKQLEDFQREVFTLGIKRVDWIGPPALEVFTADQISQLYRALTETLDAKRVTLWDSRKWVKKYPHDDLGLVDDGVHFFHEEGKIVTSYWARSASKAITKAISELPAQ